MQTMKTAFIVTPKSQLRNFVNQIDRDYFSKPVEVEILKTLETGLLWVKDHRRGHEYPCCKNVIVSKYRLSVKQLKAATANAG